MGELRVSHRLKLGQEPISPCFPSPPGGALTSQISSITTQVWECEPAFPLMSNQWKNMQEHRKGWELQNLVYLALSLPAAVIPNQGTHLLDYGLVNLLFGIY